MRGRILLTVLGASVILGLASGSAFGGDSSKSYLVHAPKPTHTANQNKMAPGQVAADSGLLKMKKDRRTPSWEVRASATPNTPHHALPKSTVTPPRNRPHS